MIVERSAIVEEMRRWLDTPFHHQQAVRGVGCDCVGLLRGVREAVTGEATRLRWSYHPGMVAHVKIDRLTPEVARLARKVDRAMPGDVLVFGPEKRDRRDVAIHCGFYDEWPHVAGPLVLHACIKAGKVIHTPLRGEIAGRVRGVYRAVEIHG